MRKALIILAVVASFSSAWAAVRPTEISAVIKAPKPYGTASLTRLFLTAYEASLWTDASVWSMDAPFALSVAYQMSFTREQLIERTLDEMKRVAPRLTDGDAARFGAMLVEAYASVKPGDRITAIHLPGGPVQFFHNGRTTAQVGDPGFAEPFFAVWLSPRTSEPRVRAGLLNIKE